MLRTLPDECADLCIIDPPYEFDTGGGAGCFGIERQNYHKEYLALYHEETDTSRKEGRRVNACIEAHRKNTAFVSHGFDFAVLDELERVLKAWNIYVWCSKAQVSKLLNYFIERNCNIDILTWHKTNPIPACNNTYLADTEYCVFARERGVRIYGTVATKHKYYVTPANVADKKKYGHPTIKPQFIIENLITNSSQEGDTVIDCFMGSGTTGAAAKVLGRNFIGIELDEKYFNTAKMRIESEEVNE